MGYLKFLIKGSLGATRLWSYTVWLTTLWWPYPLPFNWHFDWILHETRLIYLSIPTKPAVFKYATIGLWWFVKSCLLWRVALIATCYQKMRNCWWRVKKMGMRLKISIQTPVLGPHQNCSIFSYLILSDKNIWWYSGVVSSRPLPKLVSKYDRCLEGITFVLD